MSFKSFECGFSNTIRPMFHRDHEHALSEAWKQRSHELTAIRLQEYADALYVDFATDFLGKRKEFMNKLLEKVKTATSPRDLWIPVYTFHVCHTASRVIPFRAYDNGWHSTMSASLRDDDGYVDTVLPRRSLYQIFRYTDVCKRLALLWGGREFALEVKQTGKIIHEEPELTVHEYALVLSYWPRGLSQITIGQLKKVEETYLTHSPYYPAGLQTEYSKLTVIPSTPPRITSSLHPPGAPVRPRPLPVRTNGGGIPFPSLDSDSE